MQSNGFSKKSKCGMIDRVSSGRGLVGVFADLEAFLKKSRAGPRIDGEAA